MNSSSTLGRAAAIACATALATFASVSHADPINLTGHCIVTSLVPGQGQCSLLAMLADDYVAPAAVKKAQIKVNGVVVSQGINDSVSPAGVFTSTVSASLQVACGASYNATGFIMRQGATTYEQVGHLPAIACPPAP